MVAKRIQKTWWGEKFVSALEAYIDSGRLQRGKAYRTDNRILDFKINGNEIKATLRGNINPYFGVTKEPRYKVILKFEKISQKQWQSIIKNMSGNAHWLSKLMLNEIPGSIEDAFGSDNLLPSSYEDVQGSCSCPDYCNPCKHIAGVYYRIANLLDSNPMLLFQLRGLDPEKLHQELKKTELGKAFSEHLTLPENIELEYQQYKYTPAYIKRDKKTQTVNTKQFWSMPAAVHLIDEEQSSDDNTLQESTKTEVKGWPSTQQNRESISEISAALIKKQGDYPAFWTKNNSFINAMELFYFHTRKKNNKELF